MTQTAEGIAIELTEAPIPTVGDNEVLVRVEYSSLNYKDALALAARPGVLRAPSAIAGIDAAGVIVKSKDARWKPGDRVIVTGRGLGETRDGGFAEHIAVHADWLQRIPDVFTTRQAAGIGTAGFTAALCVRELQVQDSLGAAADPVVVTGAGGGVGTIAIALLASRGVPTVAVTGRPQLTSALLDLGATAVLPRHEFEEPGKPLQPVRWSGGIDTVGGPILANVIAQCQPGATVAACGNASGMQLPTTVAPFILRGVRLSGINSVTPRETVREECWRMLASDLPAAVIDSLSEIIGLEDTVSAASRVLSGSVHGRIVVDVQN